MKFDAFSGAIEPFNWYVVTTVLFFLISVFSTFVAVHNSKPLTCDNVVWNEHKNLYVCEVDIR